MANEPDLHPQTSDEWVAYLKQLMQHWGYWHGDTDEEFSDELAAAVRTLQQTCGVDPADGVVRADTWAILTGETAASQEHSRQQAHESSAGQPNATPVPHAGHEAHGAHDVHATQVPASFEQGGSPAYEFAIDPVPIAELDISTPEYDAHVELSVTGTLNVAFPGHIEGVTMSSEGLQYEASQAVQGLAHGVQLSGLGSDNLSIGDSWGSQYAQSSVRLESDGAMVFHGQVQISHTEPTQSGDLVISGTLGYDLKVTIVVHPTPEEPEPQPVHDEESWFRRHETLTLVGVAVVLIGIGVAVTLATAGTGTAPAEAAALGALGAAGAL